MSAICPSNSVSYFDLVKRNIKENDLVKSYLPAVTVLATTALFVPNAGIAVKAGVAIISSELVVRVLTKNPLVRTLYKSDTLSTETNTRIIAILRTTFVPWAIGIVRDMFLPLSTRAVLWLAPNTSVLMASPAISVAAFVSVVAFAVFRGSYGIKPMDKVVATASEIAYGIINISFGRTASIITHTTVNTIGGLINNLLCNKTEIIEQKK